MHIKHYVYLNFEKEKLEEKLIHTNKHYFNILDF
jgi:hypothetical protein